MKTIEALISLMVLLSFTSFTLLESQPENEPTLLRYQLAEDIWRICYLKGCFNQSVDLAEGENEIESRSIPVILEIEGKTGLAIAFQAPLEIAGNRLPGEDAISITKTVIVDGIPKGVQLRVGTPAE
ncbi:hypothetical protein GF415_04750 [Candidatus Micrarchaeota archaeon]|nr:hypothetical protein [Candidatus Micrarchaeota archaeon]